MSGRPPLAEGHAVIALARSIGVDPRELYERRLEAFSEEIAIVHLRLSCEALPVSDDQLAGVIESLDRARLAWHGVDGRRVGERRCFVLRVLESIGRLAQRHDAGEDPFAEWIEMQAAEPDDGPYVDIAAVLAAEENSAIVTSAARAWAAYLDAPARPGRHSGATALYAALRAVLVLIPDVGDLGDDALRQLVSRARKIM